MFAEGKSRSVSSLFPPDTLFAVFIAMVEKVKHTRLENTILSQLCIGELQATYGALVSSWEKF